MPVLQAKNLRKIAEQSINEDAKQNCHQRVPDSMWNKDELDLPDTSGNASYERLSKNLCEMQDGRLR